MKRVWRAVTWRLYLLEARVAGAPLRSPQESVVLTFDDGPHPDSTPRVLACLRELGVRANFFCVGENAERHPSLVRRILDEGHELGSHSHTHLTAQMRPHAALTDFRRGREAVEGAAGRSVPLFRPPHGKLSVRCLKALRSEFDTRLWSLDPGDYLPGTTSADIERLLGAASPGDIVLLHDALKEALPGAPPRSVVSDALPGGVGAIRHRGLSFESPA